MAQPSHPKISFAKKHDMEKRKDEKRKKFGYFLCNNKTDPVFQQKDFWRMFEKKSATVYSGMTAGVSRQ